MRALALGVMAGQGPSQDGCLSIGRGCINYPAIRSALERIGYEGFITIEQERDPRNAGGSLADVKASRDYLRSVGF